MTTIAIQRWSNGLWVSAQNHCQSRDVCNAVSTVASVLVQYTEFFKEDNGGFRVEKATYDSGNVALYVVGVNPKTFEKYMIGANAIIIGFEMLAANFPDEVQLKIR